MTNAEKIIALTFRRNLLMERNPVENANIIRKLDRKIRNLSKEEK